MTDTIKTGDIFYNSWGYDQTNIDWYQVVGITKSGKSVKIREIGAQIAGAPGCSDMSGRSTPVKGAFISPDVLTKRIRKYDGEFNLPMKYGWCPKWDGTPKYVSWYA